MSIPRLMALLGANTLAPSLAISFADLSIVIVSIVLGGAGIVVALVGQRRASPPPDCETLPSPACRWGRQQVVDEQRSEIARLRARLDESALLLERLTRDNIADDS